MYRPGWTRTKKDNIAEEQRKMLECYWEREIAVSLCFERKFIDAGDSLGELSSCDWLVSVVAR
jgi:hypothetical protein